MNELAPSHDDLYRALLARDERMNDRWFVAVLSTRIFCRLSCPARKPKARNCRFFPTAAECLSAGFRPCKRCHPLNELSPTVRALLAALEELPEARWSESDLVDLGYDPSTVRRTFKRELGVTFLSLARLRRLQRGSTALGAGGRVIDAQLEAGFESGSGFRAAVAQWLGGPPASLTGAQALAVDWIECSLGSMVAVADDEALHLLEFADRRALGGELRRLRDRRGPIAIGSTVIHAQLKEELGAYFRGESARFATPVHLHGTPLERAVWEELLQIPVGETRSYREIAEAIGRPTSFRPVARANGANTIAIVVPCHRVVGSDGSMTGYGGGIWRKRKLIAIEERLARR